MVKQNRISTKRQKNAMLKALKGALGVVTVACNKVGITRETHYAWCKKDAKYREQVNDIDNIAIDYSESKLFSLIKDKNPQAVMFHLKTRGRNRGYVERQEVEMHADIVTSDDFANAFEEFKRRENDK